MQICRVRCRDVEGINPVVCGHNSLRVRVPPKPAARYIMWLQDSTTAVTTYRCMTTFPALMKHVEVSLTCGLSERVVVIARRVASRNV